MRVVQVVGGSTSLAIGVAAPGPCRPRTASYTRPVRPWARDLESASPMGDARPPSDPLVSVVIPTKDRRERVLDAVAGVRAQEDVRTEIVVVDDGSSDGTADALGAIEGVVVVRHERAQGVARARNAGIAAGRGELVAFLDDDDRWAPAKLRRQLDALARDGARWGYAGALQVDDAGDLLEEEPAPSPQELRENI